jgi:chromate transporter
MSSGQSRPAGTVGLRQLALVLARVGAFGFGGGMGMLAILREHTVKRRRWVSEDEFATAVALAQMIPGPFIPNCVEYIGYRLRGIKGMLVAALAFLLPSVLAILVLSAVYLACGDLPQVKAAFAGVAPVVAGILVVATGQIAQRSCRSWRATSVALLAFVLQVLKVDVLLTVVVCGLLGILLFVNLRSRTLYGIVPWLFAPWYFPAAFALEPGVRLPQILARALELFGVFLKIGSVVWGGGFAALPFIRQEVVDIRPWLSAREFVDGVALGQITPGPVAITATFVGYKVLGIIGALLATVGMFLPSLVMLIVVLRIYDRVREHPVIRGFLLGVMPAVVGMLLSAAFFIGREALVVGTLPVHGIGLSLGAGLHLNVLAAMLTLAGIALLWLVRLDPVWLVLGGAGLGLLLRGWL